MITSADQLTIGREVWHIYGHMEREAAKWIINGPVCKHELTGTYYVDVIRYYRFCYQNSYDHGQMFLNDVGINRIHNMNRIFETEEQALAFYDSPECMQYRYNARRNDFYHSNF
jgi:hypothetical protein